jgi:cysteate synthase
MRLIEDGRFGNNQMQLMVSQNAPFVPMYLAWKNKSRDIPPIDDDEARRQIQIIDAQVLSNRKPPYGIIGGMYDALMATKGDVLMADNTKARQAMQLFESLEGNDIHPASGVMLASFLDAIQNKKIDKEAIIMLNITGGGEKKFKAGKKIWYLKPDIIFPLNPNKEDVLKQIETLF